MIYDNYPPGFDQSLLDDDEDVVIPEEEDEYNPDEFPDDDAIEESLTE